jgi:hypothetical protein
MIGEPARPARPGSPSAVDVHLAVARDIVKSYAETPAGRGRYSPPRIVSIEKDDKIGFPHMNLVRTSMIERQNLTIRMQVRRLTCLTNAL